jgi:hypothetical protein
MKIKQALIAPFLWLQSVLSSQIGWWQNVVRAPFRSWRSFLRLAIGSTASMPYWYALSHHLSAAVQSLTFMLIFLSAGYSVRLFRTVAAADGQPFELPSWGPPYGDILKTVVAGVMGAAAISLPSFAGVAFIGELTSWLLSGHLVTNHAALAEIWPAIIDNGQSIGLIALPLAAVLTYVWLFLPTMMAHYAISGDGRLTSVWEWKEIAKAVNKQLRPMLQVVLFQLLVVGLLNIAFRNSFLVLAIVGFAADVFTWGLVGQCYLAARKA